MSFTYLIVLIAVLAISPFVLMLASKQNKEIKQNLKIVYIFILFAQILLGLFNWENFSVGRIGFDLSLAYPESILGLFFIISALQIILLLSSKSFNSFVVILNFIGSVTIFIGMIRLSSILGFQAVSLASVGAVFLALMGNVLALAFINKDKNLLKKYPY